MYQADKENVMIDFVSRLSDWADGLAANQGFWDGAFRDNSGKRIRRPLDPLKGEMAPFYFNKDLRGRASELTKYISYTSAGR